MNGMFNLHWYGWILLTVLAGLAAYDGTVVAGRARRGELDPGGMAYLAIWIVAAVALVVS